MAFTGRLGTSDSQLGNIVLGSSGGGGTVTDDFSLDAVVLKTQSGGFDLDAVLLATQSDSFDLDAVLVLVTTGTLDLDAVIQKTQEATANTDAVVLATQADSADLDAYLIELGGVEDDFTLDAWLHKEQIANFGLAAYVLGQGHSRLTDHFGEQDDTTITVGGELLRDVLDRLFDAAYGIVVPSGRFGLDAFIQPYLTLNAVLHKGQSASFGIDARISRGASFGISAIVRERFVTTQFGISAYIVG